LQQLDFGESSQMKKLKSLLWRIFHALGGEYAEIKEIEWIEL